MNILSLWQSALLNSWFQVVNSTLLVLPTIFGAIIVFAVGLVLAYWVKKLAIDGLKLLKIQDFLKKSGVDAYLAKADIKLTLIEVIGAFLQWIIVLVFFLAAVDILGLNVVSEVLARVLSYIPNVLAAALIFAAGYMVAGLAETLVRGALASVDHEISKPIGKLARYVIILVALFAAIDQLQIAQGLIVTFFQGLTYTIVLVVGLSVGLGAKDLVSKVLNDWYEKLKK